MSLLSSAEVAKKVNVGLTTFKTKVKHDERFPKPVKLTKTSHPKWRESDINDYINSL
jgi:predicted DNA-binding transcriptional regulator AlpA